MVRTASPRIGASTVIAFLAIALLLAGGFGLMGGRNPASPMPSGAAVAGSPTPGPTPTPGPPTEPPLVTEVTPWSPCSSPSDAPPEVRLEVASTAHLGQLEMLWTESGSPAPSVPAGATYAISIPAYTTPEIWIVGARCALSWTISVDGEEFDRYINVPRDPRVASQNRFSIGYVARFGGLDDAELLATLSFPSFTARVRWLLNVEPWPRPAVTLSGSGGTMAMSPGCDVEYQLPQDTDRPGICDRDLLAPPTRKLVVGAGEQNLAIAIPGWFIEDGVYIECGSINVDGYFEGDATCEYPATIDGSTALFKAPSETGLRVLRAAMCGRPGSSAYVQTMCLTWFANLDVRPAPGQ